MNLRKQVEPLKKAALQASSLQRHAHHAASRLTWVKRWLKRAYRHHAQSRELEPLATDPIGSEFTVQERGAAPCPSEGRRRQTIRRRSTRRSSSPARSASSPVRRRAASRQRNSSSAILRAVRTASRSESPVGVWSAAMRIFSST